MAAKKKPVEGVKLQILEKFNELIVDNHRSIIPDEVARKIWSLWQEYTGRKSVYRNCSVCLYSKVKYLKKEYVRLQPKKEEEKIVDEK